MNQEELLRHMEWADAQLWTAVTATPEAVGDGELKERWHHVHLVQGVFLQVWRGEDMKVRELPEFPQLEDILRWGRAYYAELWEFLRSADEAVFETNLRLPWSQSIEERYGVVRPTNLRETLTQVLFHTTHHRGQISTRLRALGGEPPVIDYIMWLLQGRPAPEWPPASRQEP